jgi:hypothetical protein
MLLRRTIFEFLLGSPYALLFYNYSTFAETCFDLTLSALGSFINRLFHYSLTLDQLNHDLLYR